MMTSLQMKRRRFGGKNQDQRPAINPDFAPDESCLFDAYQLKCVPGAEQDCHEVGFWNYDDSTCFPVNENGN